MWSFFISISLSAALAGAKTPSSAPASETYSYPLQKIGVKGLTDIKIVGVKGTLRLRGRAHGKFIGLKVQHSKSTKYADWHLSMDRRGTTLFLEVFNVAYGAQWNSQVKQEAWPEFNIDLDGLALPTTVNWREGRIEVTNWDAPLEASFLKGQAVVRGGKGKLTLQPVEATVEVRDHTGAVVIKGESGKVKVTKLEGDLDLSWLNGEVAVTDTRGKLHIESGDSHVLVQGGRGEMNIALGGGSARIAGFEGVIHGKGETAKWDVIASAPSDLNFTTSTGPVNVRWKAGGARIFLTSTQGTIKFPAVSFLKQADRDGKKIVEGLKSAKSMGQVFVRTDSGAIAWQ